MSKAFSAKLRVGDHAKLVNAKTARRKARERVRRYIPSDVSLSNELMAERKAEARLK